MTVLVDTCGWIELLTDGPLCAAYGPLLADLGDVIVPTVVQYELYRWVCRERDEATALEVVAATQGGRVRPLDTRVALLAADLSLAHGLAMADAQIYAHARVEDAELVTSDSHFVGLPGVRYLTMLPETP